MPCVELQLVVVLHFHRRRLRILDLASLHVVLFLQAQHPGFRLWTAVFQL